MDQEQLEFHVASNDYFGTLATILDLASQDLLAGVTDIAIQSLASFSPHIRANKVRAIAVTGDKRTPALPDTPTLIEQGIKPLKAAFPKLAVILQPAAGFGERLGLKAPRTALGGSGSFAAGT